MLAWCSSSSDFCSDMPSKRCPNRCRTHSPANDVCSIGMCRAEGILGISASMTAFHSCHIVYMCIERYLLTARRYRQGKLYTQTHTHTVWLTHGHTHALVNTQTHTPGDGQSAVEIDNVTRRGVHTEDALHCTQLTHSHTRPLVNTRTHTRAHTHTHTGLLS